METLVKFAQTIINNVSSNLQEALPYVLKFQVYLFVALLAVATIGKKLGFRRVYITLLDRMFKFAAKNMDKNDFNDEDIIEENGVDISPFPNGSSKSPPNEAASSFTFDDLMPYFTAGMRSVVQDSVSSKFVPEETPTWNMLSRTKRARSKRTRSVTTLWVLGFVFRYFFLLPVRIVIFSISLSTLIVSTFLVGLLPEGNFKKKVNALAITWCFDFVANSISVFARFNNREHRPMHGIAVSNHTSPIDSMLLATDNCYDMVGQISPGILGVFMKALSKSSTHIWFDRNNSTQKRSILDFMQDHAQDRSLPPLLIYPEGVCINNTAVFLFRKGVFQLDTVIHPIAIKFDARYGDAFWWQDNFGSYIFSMITSWAIVCDIWYLPPMSKKQNEYPEEFADRVKAAIANAGGLEELSWDGSVKNIDRKPLDRYSKEELWRKRQQFEYSKHLEPLANEITIL